MVMASLHITLFGRLRCTVDHEPVGGMEPRKVQELLAYLLLHRTHPCTRESLATLMWGERHDAQARKYLRQVLWQLHSALDAACHSADSLLHVDAEWVGINPAALLWLDIDRLEDAYKLTHQIEGHDLTESQVDTLRQAVALYQGDLLDGWYQDWCIFERERFQQIYLTLLDKLIAYAEHSLNYLMGIHYCELALRSDPARERTHRRLMRLHYRAGNRTGALRQYETCVAMLRRELDIEPANSTLLLYQQICSDQGDAPAPVVAPGAQAVVDLNELRDILLHLGQVQATLVQSIQQVQREIGRIETLVHQYAAAAPKKARRLPAQDANSPRPRHSQRT
jgi:DNA-binding SARP family transcriptional activator